jgi:hypothetical protein
MPDGRSRVMTRFCPVRHGLAIEPAGCDGLWFHPGATLETQEIERSHDLMIAEVHFNLDRDTVRRVIRHDEGRPKA